MAETPMPKRLRISMCDRVAIKQLTWGINILVCFHLWECSPLSALCAFRCSAQAVHPRQLYAEIYCLSHPASFACERTGAHSVVALFELS